MNAHEIESLNAEWLDKTVEVRPDIPELRRFAGRRGIVKSVNWSGRCLVEWDAGQDVGWYDIVPEQLVRIEDATAGAE